MIQSVLKRKSHKKNSSRLILQLRELSSRLYRLSHNQGRYLTLLRGDPWADPAVMTRTLKEVPPDVRRPRENADADRHGCRRPAPPNPAVVRVLPRSPRHGHARRTAGLPGKRPLPRRPTARRRRQPPLDRLVRKALLMRSAALN